MNKKINIISVIVPTYRPNYYIWECLESLRKQTIDMNLFEVIIVLNGDKKTYLKQLGDYIRKNNLNNFKLFYTMEKGVSNARNIGLEKAKGSYIAFLDDDDYFNKNYLLNFYEDLNENYLFIAEMINFERNSKKHTINNYILGDKTKNFFKYRKEFSYIGGKIIPVKIISNFRFNTKYENREDSLFMMQISKNIKYIKTSRKRSIYWRRIRKESASQKKKEIIYILKNSIGIIGELLYLLSRKGYNKFFILLKIFAIIKGTIIELKK